MLPEAICHLGIIAYQNLFLLKPYQRPLLSTSKSIPIRQIFQIILMKDNENSNV